MVSDVSRQLHETEAAAHCQGIGAANVFAGNLPGFQIKISTSEKMCLPGAAVRLRQSNLPCRFGFRKGSPFNRQTR